MLTTSLVQIPLFPELTHNVGVSSEGDKDVPRKSSFHQVIFPREDFYDNKLFEGENSLLG